MLYDKQPVKRYETVVAKGHACLLQLKVSDLDAMLDGLKLGGGATLCEDFRTLVQFLGSNYDTKTEWRKEAGIISASPKAATGLKMTGAMKETFKHPNATNSNFY